MKQRLKYIRQQLYTVHTTVTYFETNKEGPLEHASYGRDRSKHKEGRPFRQRVLKVRRRKNC
jgi:hypothetical protein